MKRFPWWLALSLWPAWAMAGPSSGDPLQFLLHDSNARASALGGAYTALAADSNALFYNPAGLGLARRYEGSMMHDEFITNSHQDSVGICVKQGFGLSGNYRAFTNIPKTTVDNPWGAGLGRYGISSLALGMGYGKAVLPNLSFGVGYKYIYEQIDDIASNSHAVDVGVLLVPRPRMSLGFAVQNLGPPLRFNATTENLPLNFRWGAAYGFDMGGAAFTVSVDGMRQREDRTHVGSGIEGVFLKMLAFRLGYSSRNDGGPGITWGGGVKYKTLSFDYAVAPYGKLGWSHRAGATFRWGGGEDWPDFEPPQAKLRPRPAPGLAAPSEEAPPAPKPKKAPGAKKPSSRR
ncbi:MAG: PorV/PorQ family protein [Elusimicrobia bacterium]|nr:PorV/PorQ family protein [Elusimicrobiota bacterium]